MNIFIASSRESLEEVRQLAIWVEELEHEPLPWDDPRVFIAGEYTLSKLIEITRKVDAAIFVFGEDDRTWYRATMVHQPRDNVLIEYGLFAGVLGPERTIVCKKGKARTPDDLGGLTHVDVSRGREQQARARIREWIKALERSRESFYSVGKPQEVIRIVADNRQILDREYREGKYSASKLDIVGVALSSALAEILEDEENRLLKRVLFNNAQVRMMFLTPLSFYVKQRAIEDGDSAAQLEDLLKRSVMCAVGIFKKFRALYQSENQAHRIRPASMGFLEIRMIDFCPHFTIYRTDNVLLWGIYTSATRGDHSAVLKVERTHGALFRQLIQHFDKLWHMGLLDSHTAENYVVKCHSRIPPELNGELVKNVLGVDWKKVVLK